jgi:hypothetical protein
LTNDSWNRFSINPAINSNVPLLLIDWLNQWINLTISVYVGGQWFNQSTVLSNGVVMDVPQAGMSSSPSYVLPPVHLCSTDTDSDGMRDYYMSTLMDFYQAYFTLVRLAFWVVASFSS